MRTIIAVWPSIKADETWERKIPDRGNIAKNIRKTLET